MPLFKNYNLADFTTSGGIADLARLDEEVRASSIKVALDGIGQAGSIVTVTFKGSMDADDETVLDGLVAAHSGMPLPEEAQPVDLGGVRDIRGGTVISTAPYAHSTEDGHFLGNSVPYNAPAGVLSFFDEPSGPHTIFVQGGWGWHTAANLGDYIEFSVVDKDDVLGLFAVYGLTVGVDVLELNKFVSKLRPEPWDGVIDARAKTAGAVLPGLYLRLAYNNVGPLAVDLAVTYEIYMERT
jgi:hypothetical protein